MSIMHIERVPKGEIKRWRKIGQEEEKALKIRRRQREGRLQERQREKSRVEREGIETGRERRPIKAIESAEGEIRD